MVNTLFTKSSGGLYKYDDILISNISTKNNQVLSCDQVMKISYFHNENVYLDVIEAFHLRENIKPLMNWNYVEPEILRDFYSVNSNYTLNTMSIRNVFSDRSITMNFIDDIYSFMNHFLCTNGNSYLGIYFHEFDLSNFHTRICWLYLGKSLTKSKYSPVVIVNTVRKPKF